MSWSFTHLLLLVHPESLFSRATSFLKLDLAQLELQLRHISASNCYHADVGITNITHQSYEYDHIIVTGVDFFLLLSS